MINIVLCFDTLMQSQAIIISLLFLDRPDAQRLTDKFQKYIIPIATLILTSTDPEVNPDHDKASTVVCHLPRVCCALPGE